MGAHDWIGNLVQNGAIDPIPMTDTTKNLFQKPTIQAVTFDSQIYGVPFALENTALYRNTDLAPTAPATWEELQATAPALQSAAKVSELLALSIGTDGGPAVPRAAGPHLRRWSAVRAESGRQLRHQADGNGQPEQHQMR
jgi:ABC-type glycerol-3-phosphate transport system substrate-binding protein